MPDSDPIERLKNLGPVTARGLREIGIETIADLRRTGPTEAYIALRTSQPKFNKVVLWALAMGLENRHWTDITQKEKQILLSGLR